MFFLIIFSILGFIFLIIDSISLGLGLNLTFGLDSNLSLGLSIFFFFVLISALFVLFSDNFYSRNPWKIVKT